ncbi:MAG: pyridoxamine 5'-phosphate oxidase [Cytophagales bacterium]|nr:MAG: pyridoxamine 5'-phosphate oxidase [Cytophagales bacterium]
MIKIDSFRQNYTKNSLEESKMLQNPIFQLEQWLENAIESKILEPNAMVLSTVDIENRPHARVVLAKGISEEGIQFFTNYNSNKAQDLEKNKQACLTFFYPEMERQVRIEGIVDKITLQESEKYFHSRPFESQIGAWVSNQSQVIHSREILEDKQKELQLQFKDKVVPLPDFWGGYILKPTYFEFWQGRANRLHDRIVYELKNNKWEIFRLAP